MFCFWDWDGFRQLSDKQGEVYTFYNGHEERTPVLIEHLDCHSLGKSLTGQPIRKGGTYSQVVGHES